MAFKKTKNLKKPGTSDGNGKIAKKTPKQQNTSKVKGKKQLNTSKVRGMSQFMTQPSGKPAQKRFETRPSFNQKKTMNGMDGDADDNIMARIRRATRTR